MANKDNQSKQYRIYIKESKSWVDVNKEFYTNYYRDINAYRKRQQEHGRCVCPASKRYTFFAAVYGFIIYNVGKIIFYLVSYAVYHIRRDINKYKSNKDKQ